MPASSIDEQAQDTRGSGESGDHGVFTANEVGIDGGSTTTERPAGGRRNTSARRKWLPAGDDRFVRQRHIMKNNMNIHFGQSRITRYPIRLELWAGKRQRAELCQLIMAGIGSPCAQALSFSEVTTDLDQ